MTEQTNREKALALLDTCSAGTAVDVAIARCAGAQVYALLDLADAIREQTNIQASYLMDLTDAVRRLENLGPMDPLLGKP